MRQHDFELGGPSFHWHDLSQFDDEDGFNRGKEYRAVGWMRRQPKIGEYVLAEFTQSWVLFVVTEVKYMSDPSDMFFADLKPVDQEVKPYNPPRIY